jgi:hypothetical protein
MSNFTAIYPTLPYMRECMVCRVSYAAIILSEINRPGIKWVQLVMNCVTSVTYSVIVNGSPVGRITPSRGIRQGDPLSPYLFILCAEVLSTMLQNEEVSGHLKGVPTSYKGMRINHLFFADDSVLFCKATEQEWNYLRRVLGVYEAASGQRLNDDKTSIFFSRNTNQETRTRILEVVGVQDSQRFDTYLGLPALVGKSRMREFQNLRERVEKRLSDWKTKFLTQAGKEVLLKAVVQAIPTYSMSIFLLPKELCKELNKLMQKFWWGHKENDKKNTLDELGEDGTCKRSRRFGFPGSCMF